MILEVSQVHLNELKFGHIESKFKEMLYRFAQKNAIYKTQGKFKNVMQNCRTFLLRIDSVQQYIQAQPKTVTASSHTDKVEMCKYFKCFPEPKLICKWHPRSECGS